MSNHFRRLPVIVFLLVAIAMGFPAPASAEDPPRVMPQFHVGQLLSQPPEISEQQIIDREAFLEQQYWMRRNGFDLPVDPSASGISTVSPSTLGGSLQPLPALPDDFTIFRDTVMNDTFTNDSTSSTNEPSLGMTCGEVLYTGNWYASLSTDYGQTFSFINPATFFPSVNNGFCCDQVVYYEPSRGIMLWYLQYVSDATGNTVRLAVTDDPANIATRVWYYDITPQLFGFAAGIWFDFPDLSASDNFLYITTNFGNMAGSIVMRLDLDDLANAAGVTLENFRPSLPNMRATHGAAGTMYVGTQVDTDTLRIFSWPEGNAAPTSVDRNVDQYFKGSSAPSPDGTDWVARDFNDILAAWVADGNVGFMWGSAQGGGFTWPNVRYARFNQAGLGLSDQGQIWNPDTAWAYPAVHPNDNGNIGGVIAAGGGGTLVPWPSLFAWISDDVNGDTIVPLENRLVSNGDDGPNSNRWGDYYTSRRQDPYGNTWAAGGHVMRGGGGGTSTEPHFVWFGRESDAPAGPQIFCPGDKVVECSATGGTPSSDSQLDPFFGGVTAVDECDDPEITDDAPLFFPLGDTPVTFTAENGNGLTDSCTDTVSVVDTTGPAIVCPANITVECAEDGGTQASHPSLIPFFTGFAAPDVCDPDPATSNNAPGFFPLGDTAVTFTAVDDSGNVAVCVATVTVEDTTPPVMSCPASLDLFGAYCLGFSYVPLDPAYATDICSDVTLESLPPTVGCDLTETVTIRATDTSGNFSECDISVSVECRDPRSQGWWNRQCLGAGMINPGRNGRGPQEPLEPDFVKTLVPAVDLRLQATIFELRTCQDGMDAQPPNDPCERAQSKYTSMLLNLEAERIHGECTVDLASHGCSSTNIDDLVDEIAALINTNDPNLCRQASQCAQLPGLDNAGSGPSTTQDDSDGSTAGESEAGTEEPLPEESAPAVSEPLPEERTISIIGSPAIDSSTTGPQAEPVVPSAFLVIEEPTLNGSQGDTAGLSADGAKESDLSGKKAVEHQLAALADISASADLRSRAESDLLTALGGGYDPAMRLRIARALVDEVDEKLHSLLRKHLEDIRAEAGELERQDLVDEVETLLKRLED